MNVLSSGDISLWATEGRAIHIKAVTQSGDPVEFNEEEAKELVAALQKLIETNSIIESISG